MKTSVKLSGIVAALMLAVSGAAMSAEQVSPYVHSSDGKIVKSGKGKKITVFTYRPKKDSKRKMGHRQPYTKVEITAINA